MTTISIKSDYNIVNNITIITGELTISKGSDEYIVLSPNINETSIINIICCNNSDLFDLRSALSNTETPVLPIGINIYDAIGNVVQRYEQSRTNNLPGNINISASNNLISDIIIKPDTDCYLLLNYPAIKNIESKQSKQQLVVKDLERFESKYNLKNVTVYMDSLLYYNLKELYDFNIIISKFKNIVITDDNRKSFHLINDLCGKKIRTSQCGFQGLLSFGNNYTILAANAIQTTMKIRSNGVQISSQNNVESDKFYVILALKENATVVERRILASEQSTDNFIYFDICDNTLCSEFIDFIDKYSKLLMFYNDINASKNVSAIASNPNTLYYLYNPLFKLNDLLSIVDINRLIYNDYKQLYTVLHSILVKHISYPELDDLNVAFRRPLYDNDLCVNKYDAFARNASCNVI